ncbi:hypothetical protein I4U23_008866 [Adineta vaga]|nr:hypothetical protein I4U23_008866 [Adineta vaga]
MNPWNNMYDTLVSVDHVLQKRCKQTTNISDSVSINSPMPLNPDIKSKVNVTKNSHNQLHTGSLTEDNFHRAHLCNRTIDEFPNTTIHDIERFKLMNVYTIQDLLGRFLIHDTSEDFHTFLMNTFRLSEKTASTISHLFNQWTKYNLDGISIDHRRSNSIQSLR